MLLLVYFAELVISSLRINASGIANAVGISISTASTVIVVFPSNSSPDRSSHSLLEISFEFHARLMIEDV